MDLIAKLYSTAGEEVELKPGHTMVIGKGSCAQLPMYTEEQVIAELVYRPVYLEDELKAELDDAWKLLLKGKAPKKCNEQIHNDNEGSAGETP